MKYYIGKSTAIDLILLTMAIDNLIRRTEIGIQIQWNYLTANEMADFSFGQTENKNIDNTITQIETFFTKRKQALFFLPISIPNEHYTLLAIKKNAEQYEVIYVDSNGNSQLYLKEKGFYLSVSQLASSFCDRIIKVLNISSINVTNKIDEIYQYNNDGGIHVLENIKLLIQLVNEQCNFTAQEFWLKAKKNDFNHSNKMTEKRLKFVAEVRPLLKLKSQFESDIVLDVTLADFSKYHTKIDTDGQPFSYIDENEKKKPDYKRLMRCGKGQIDLFNLAALMKNGLITLKQAKDSDLFPLIGLLGSGKSLLANYLIDNPLKRIGRKIGFSHGLGLQLIYPNDVSQLTKKIDQWKQTHDIGHVLVAPVINNNGKVTDYNGWRLILITGDEKQLVERHLDEGEIKFLTLHLISNEEDIDDFNLDPIFYFIIDEKIFSSYPCRFSVYLNKNYPGSRRSSKSQTTNAATYIDIFGNAILDTAGLGDTRVEEFLEKGIVKNGTPEEALMTTMSLKMAIEKAGSIKGLILVIPKHHIEDRSKLLLQLLKDLITSMPDLISVDQIKALAPSMIIVVTHLNTTSDGKELDARDIKDFKRSVIQLESEVSKDVEDKKNEIMRESFVGKLKNKTTNVFANMFYEDQDISEIKKRVIQDPLIIEDLGILTMLEIVKEKIDSNKVIFINPTDDGQSRELMNDRIKELATSNQSISKKRFEFSGANKVHQAFIQSIVLLATHGIELLSKRDEELPTEIESTNKKLLEKSKNLSYIQEQIKLLDESINKGILSEENKQKMITSLTAEIDTLKRIKTLKQTEKEYLEMDVRNAKLKRDHLLTDTTSVVADWEEIKTDRRTEKHNLMKLFAFKDNSNFTVHKEFGHPFQSIRVQYGDDTRKEIEWNSYLEQTIKNETDGIYEAIYNCESWWKKHPSITFTAIIEKKYHPNTLTEIEEQQDIINIKEPKIPIIVRELNDCDTDLTKKKIELEKAKEGTIDIEVLRKNHKEASEKRQHLQEEITNLKNKIVELKQSQQAVQKDIDEEYETFLIVKEIAEITDLNQDVIKQFIIQFSKLQPQDRDTEKSKVFGSERKSGFFNSEKTKEESPTMASDVRELKVNIEQNIVENNIERIEETMNQINDKLSSLEKQLIELNEKKAKINASIQSLEVKQKTLQELFQTGKNFVETTFNYNFS